MSNDNFGSNKGSGDHQLPAPVPVRGKRVKMSDIDPKSTHFFPENPSSSHNGITSADFRAMTPNTTQRVTNRRPSYNSIEVSRESHYHLDYPENGEEIAELQLDPKSRFYARGRPRTLDLPSLLPYETEKPKDQAKFLSHIVAHLYIAVKSMDIQGSLAVTAKDLALLKNVSGLSDLDIALETDLFEANSDADFSADDDTKNYFSIDDYSESDSEDGENEDDEDAGDMEDGPADDSAAQHKKSPKSAAVVGVRIWTNELLVWLKMKYDMPISLRVALAKVYYSICLCRGQYLNLKIYVKAFELLTKDVKLLKEYKMVLEWKDLLNELENHFEAVDSSMTNIEKKDHKQLLKLAERASNFFDPSALFPIYNTLGQHISVSNPALAVCSMSLLPLVYSEEGPDSESDIRHYISSFFYIWRKFRKSHDLDSHLTSRVGTIAMSFLTELSSSNYLGSGFTKFGIFSSDQIQILLNNLQNSIGISKEKFGSSNTNFFHGYASTLVYSINGQESLAEDGILQQIKTLFNAIESFVHPTNTGGWTKAISKCTYAFIYQFHKRFNQENEKDGVLEHIPQSAKLSPEVVKVFVKIFLPIVRTGLQSKTQAAVDNYLSSLNLLAYLDSETVLEGVLLDIYESLEGVISTHRVNVALRTLDELARYFATTKIFRVHLTRLLSMAIPGIDSNDLEKTLLTLSLFQTVASFVPFHDISNGMDESPAASFTQTHMEFLQMKIYSGFEQSLYGQDTVAAFEVTEELEVSALQASTAAFPPLVRSFLERIFTLLENLPDPNKSGKIEKTIADYLPRYLYIMFESMSDELFDQVGRLVFDFIFNHTIHPVADVIAELSGAVVKRNPKFFKKHAEILISKIKDEIEENESGASRTGVDIVARDQPLYWYLVVLNECIGNAGSYVVDVSSDLNDLIYFLMDNVKGPTVFAASYLVNQTLQAVTKIRVKELRLISPSNGAVDESCWGGFQFDERRFSEDNLKFDWFLPGTRETEYAVNLFTDITSKALSQISTLISSYNKDSVKGSSSLLLTDDLRNSFLYLSYALSGISFLLDPSFEEDIPKLNQHQNETIQQRLLLLKQIRSVKEEKETAKGNDELRIENVQENLQKIVDDMSNDDFMSFGDLLDKSDDITMDDKDKQSFKEHHKEEGREKEKDGFSESSKHGLNLDRTGTSSPDPRDANYRASPGIEGVAVSQMNPAITFRERKLYTSRYFFGDDMEKRRASKTYIKLHRFRYSIGRSLHIICKFLIANFHDNTKLFKHFLYALNIWFSDVGRERLLDDSHAKINYTFISGSQNVNRVRKPFTRMAIGSRIESYHSLRVALHATSRNQTDLDKLLLEDLVKLSVSTYSAVAEPAQATLIEAMKRLNGSYNVIVKSSLRYLSKALEENSEQKILSGLNLFSLKRIEHKVQNDYFNLQRYIGLLHRCLLVDDRDVNETAQSLFNGIYDSLIPPSSTCLINLEYVDEIRPPDAFIDLEIKAVRLAKERKRDIYLDKLKNLEASIISNEKTSNYWKLSFLNLSLLIGLQYDWEIQTNNEALVLLAKRAGSDHPMISRLASKGLTKIINKLYVLQLAEYKLNNIYDLGFVSRDIEVVNTNKGKESYYIEWRKEMSNTESPSYFIDQKIESGWLFWGDKLKVVSPDSKPVNFNEKDLETVRRLGSAVSKQWFHDIVKLWIADNEPITAYQATDVHLTSALVLMISNGYTDNFELEDLFDIVEDVYEKDDKSAHIVICEIFAGMLLASKSMTKESTEKRDQFIIKFLGMILSNDISPDISPIWNVFSWWVPSHIDSRRFASVTDVITGFTLDKNSNSAIKDSIRLTLIKSFMTSLTWRANNVESVVQLCLDNINHQYQACRDQIGSLLSVLSFVYYPESIKDAHDFVSMCNSDAVVQPFVNTVKEMVPLVFEKIENWRQQVINKSPQEILKSDYIYASMTVLTWLRQALTTNVSTNYQQFMVSHIVPFIMKLIYLKEVCQMGNIDPITILKYCSQVAFSKQSVAQVVEMLESYSRDPSLTVIQSLVIGEFTETFYFKNLFQLNKNQRQRVIQFTNDLLYHKQVSVRESAASTLAGLIHISPTNEVESVIHKFTQEYRSNLDSFRAKHKKTGFKKATPEEISIVHGSTLGLGSFIHAFSFLSPPPIWVPDLLTVLANKSSGLPGAVGKTAKESLGKFKKTRQDTWHIDSKVFSDSQMQDLEGVLFKSYFI